MSDYEYIVWSVRHDEKASIHDTIDEENFESIRHIFETFNEYEKYGFGGSYEIQKVPANHKEVLK